MELHGFVLNFLPFLLILIIYSIHVSADEDRQVYIVYMGSLPKEEYAPVSHHYSLLQQVTDSSFEKNLLIRSYKKSFNGFAANITSLEAKRLRGMDGVVSVFPSITFQLQTTRSWSFIGFDETAAPRSRVESDLVIGVIDTGIWPESASFSDEGFGPTLKKWNGTCDGGKNFTCNNKLIGARYYRGFSSARDDVGHGSHTSSTAAGNLVKDTSFYGLAEGTARGGVPSARIAAYKVCSDSGCAGDAILAAFDDAIHDGVDIITISLGSFFPQELFEDPIAIGSFHAMDKGIIATHSAGNSGPDVLLTASIAPWLFSVAASSIDRKIVDKVVLGNRKTIQGTSVNSFTLEGKEFPLIYGTNASRNCSYLDARACSVGCLDSGLVKGKIVLCDNSGGIEEAIRAGARGSIMAGNEFSDVSFVVPLPALALSPDKYQAIIDYINSTKNPTANILKSFALQDPTAPTVVSFSSRGPNNFIPDIMKPDISAPGVDILAAFAPNIPPTSSPQDKRSVKFNILSGTSMACPHVAAVAAYIKSFHPDWLPSAIKSAIMTTASPMNASNNKEAEFAYGSGQINPVKAVHPGLVYEASASDYLKLLCANGYTTDDIKSITGENITCPTGPEKELVRDHNYPSMTALVTEGKPFKIRFQRTVTNVGPANSTYKATHSTDFKLDIKVVPDTLSFKSLNQKQSFNVTVSGVILTKDTIASSSFVWSDGAHSVRSPIVLFTISPIK